MRTRISFCLGSALLLLAGVLRVGAAENDNAARFKQLADPDPAVREAAATALKQSDYVPGGEIDILLKALKDDNPKVRAYAAGALSRISRGITLEIAYLPPKYKTKEVVEAVEEAVKKTIEKRFQLTPEDKVSLEKSRLLANEAAAIAACKMYAEAQEIYHRADWDKDDVQEYSQTIQGNQSLYELTAGKGDLALVDLAFAIAAFSELGAEKAKPKAGYFFKVLKGQGAKAPGGQKSFLEKDNMTLGHALVAWPAEYGKTGNRTFIISNAGKVYQKDLGADTAKTAANMAEYDPGDDWELAK